MSRRRLLIGLLMLAVGAALLAPMLRRGRGPSWPITNAYPTGTTIVALGDSLTQGYGLAAHESYPAKLSARLGRPVINAGINGNTTADALARLDSDVLRHNPRVVLVCLGGNDLRRQWPIEQTIGNLRQIVERLHGAGALVILIGVEGDGMVLRGDQGPHYRELARQTGCVYIPNFFKGILGRPSLMHDPLHPNAAGYEVFVERLMREAGEFVQR
ncbi:MAG: arylesterase [Candidatus Sumerlaeia bacterium]|nr:arylesterase [Candidatus Sumerlaeia bacterium]